MQSDFIYDKSSVITHKFKEDKKKDESDKSEGGEEETK